jgi:Ca2+-binding RTX toxin-like protein
MPVQLIVNPETQLVTLNHPTPTPSIIWDQAVQQAVIITSPGPTIASRAYSIVHTAMFDAWAAYDPVAVGTQFGDSLQRPLSENTIANKTEAMSFSAYGVLSELFPEQIEIFDQLMIELGYNPNNTTPDTTTAAGIGNITAEALLEFRREDGSNQLGNNPNGTGIAYSDISGYQPFNRVGNPINLERWTPENVPINAAGETPPVQSFLTPHWGNVIPFALDSGDQFRPPTPEPFLLVEAEYNLDAGTIILDNNTIVNISPELVGTVINPEFIAQAEQVVTASANLTDEQKLIAEFWEDGGGTSFPPGTWMTFGQFVSARDNHSLDQDAQQFFTLSNAVFDAGIATWESKTAYDYTRPIRLIRELGKLGLIGEFNPELGGYTIDAWVPGEGTQTILATEFLTYQTPGSDPSPPFAEYTSGHSAFSAASAEILRQFTGSDAFGADVTFAAGESRFEAGITPQQTITLAWDTFTEAADEAGISRIYGGIHFDDGDLNGRQLGQAVGEAVWQNSQDLITPGLKLEGSNSNDDLLGSPDNDRFYGYQGNDTLYGNTGNDLIYGSQGDDILLGHGGVDVLLGDAGNDDLYGGIGDDSLDGGVGNDTLFGDRGNDTLMGGLGRDRFILNSNNGTDIITDFEPNQDLISLSQGLTFEALNIVQQNEATVIEFNQTPLMILSNVEASFITADQFI